MSDSARSRIARRGSSTRSFAEPSTVKALYLGTYDRASPRNTQVVSCLRGAGVEVVERHRQVWGRHNWSPGPGSLVRLARAEVALSRIDPGDADVARGRVSGSRRHGHREARRARQTRSFSTRSSRWRTRWSTTAPSSPGRSPLAAVLRGSIGTPFAGQTSSSPTPRRTLRTTARGSACPRSRVAVALVGAEQALFRPAETERPEFHVLFVGKLIPLARARDDPRRRTARAGRSIRDRRGRPAGAAALRPARERRARPVDRLSRPARRPIDAPAAHWASSDAGEKAARG